MKTGQHHFSIIYDRGRMEVIDLMILKMTRNASFELFAFKFQNTPHNFSTSSIYLYEDYLVLLGLKMQHAF